MHIHAHRVDQTEDNSFRLNLDSRSSRDTNGITECLGLQVSPKVEPEAIVVLESKITEDTLLTLQ